MGIMPSKNTAWAQGLYEVSTTKKECLGALRETYDGRKFRYGLAAGTLIAGGATFGAVDVDNHVAQIQTSGAANAVGSLNVSVYVGGTVVTANQYDDGYLVIYRTTSGRQGLIYPIASHEASAAGSEIITVTLKEPLIVATYTTCYFSLYRNPWKSLVAATDVACNYTGQAFVGAASGEYLWVQTGGIAAVTGGDTATVGYPVGPSDTESSIEVASTQVGPVIGYAYGGNLVSGYCTPAILFCD